MADVPAELDLSLLAENIVYEDDILPDHGSEIYRVHDGIRRAWARAIEPFEEAENVIEWARDAGEHVVSCHRVRGRGTLGDGGGVSVDEIAEVSVAPRRFEPVP